MAELRRSGEVPEFDVVLARAASAVNAVSRTRIQPLINGTGVVIHTNLGRAPLSVNALADLVVMGGGYSNLEYDLETGRRGARGAYLESCLAQICRAESATVVNNCAAALVLILRHYTARKKEVVISRQPLSSEPVID